MAKDDYDVVIFKVLTYLYGCMKRKYSFELCSFNAVISKQNVNDEYLSDVLYMAVEDGYIEGILFTKVWGGNKIITSEMSDMKITSSGIRYLNENTKMKDVKDYLLKETPDLIRLVF